MRIRIFIVAAIVLIVFAIIAGARSSGFFWVTTSSVWLFAALLAFFTELLLGWGWTVGPATRPAAQPVPGATVPE